MHPLHQPGRSDRNHAPDRRRHAGRIGRYDTAAIHISDWRHAPVDLTIAEDGRICWSAVGADSAVAIIEHQILHFDDVALSIGAPASAEAAAPALAMPPSVAVAWRGKRRWQAVSAVAVPAALLSSALLAMQQSTHASSANESLDSLHQRVPELLAGIGQAALQIGEQDGLIVVQRVVRNGAEAGAVRELLRRVAPDHSVAHLAIVDEVLGPPSTGSTAG